MKLALLISLLACAGTTLAAPPESTSAEARRNQSLDVSASQLVGVTVIESTPFYSLVQTQINGQAVLLYLEPHSIRSANFELWTTLPNGTTQKLGALPPSHTVRGAVIGWDSTVVVGSLNDGQFSGRIKTATLGTWIVQPLSTVTPGAPRAAHVCYSVADVLSTGHNCGVTSGPRRADAIARPGNHDEHPTPGGGPSTPGPTPSAEWHPTPAPRDPLPLGFGNVCEIAFDADFEFFQLNNSSVAETVDDIERVMVDVDEIYRSQVGISYIVNRILVRTSEPDPYTTLDHEALTNQFRSEWENNQPGERDVAHLMTGKDINGGTIGYAFIGEICNRDGIIHDGAYGFSQSRYTSNMALRVGLTAHELGHNWNATHCAEIDNGQCPTSFPPTCGIMCACNGSCNGSVTTFGQPNIDQIVEHRNSRGCLGTNPSITYVDDSFVGSETGSITNPYNTLREGAWASEFGGRIIFFGGLYDADRTLRILSRPLRLEAQPGSGVVRIGQ